MTDKTCDACKHFQKKDQVYTLTVGYCKEHKQNVWNNKAKVCNQYQENKKK